LIINILNIIQQKLIIKSTKIVDFIKKVPIFVWSSRILEWMPTERADKLSGGKMMRTYKVKIKQTMQATNLTIINYHIEV
jgi:hypothetical protein